MGSSGRVGKFLDLYDTQLEQLIAMLAELPESRLWERPAPKKWCIGEVIDHTRKLNRFLRRLIVVGTPILMPLGRMRRHRPFEADIDDVYQRPGFPSQVGWIWSPGHTPKKPAPLAQLQAECAAEHEAIRRWYEARDEAVLGNVIVYDPTIGWINLVQTLRIGVYHDAHHFRAIARELGREWEDN